MLSQVSFHKGGGVTSNASLDMSHGRVLLPQTWDLGTLPPPPPATDIWYSTHHWKPVQTCSLKDLRPPPPFPHSADPIGGHQNMHPTGMLPCIVTMSPHVQIWGYDQSLWMNIIASHYKIDVYPNDLNILPIRITCKSKLFRLQSNKTIHQNVLNQSQSLPGHQTWNNNHYK